MFKEMRDAFLDRFGIKKIKETVLLRRVPKTSWYQGDGAALVVLFSTQAATGAFMTLGYGNSPDEAYQSVQFISNEWLLGGLLRGLHYWSASMMILVLVAHLFRHLLLGGYKAPREGLWTVGVFLFFFILAMSFSGYVLRWDEKGIYAVRVLLNMAYKVPLIGEHLVLFIQGGTEIGRATLSRFYSVHVVFFPAIIGLLIAYHLYLVVTKGVTSKAERGRAIKNAKEHHEVYYAAAESEKDGEWFYPKTTLQTGLFGLVTLLIAFTLALLLGPPDLFPPANLTAEAYPIEEWWFHWYSSAIALMPPWLAPLFIVGFPILLFFGLLALPLLDRGPARGIRHRPIWAFSVIILSVVLLSLTSLRLNSPWTGRPSSELPTIPLGVSLAEPAREGRKLFVQHGCNTCHAIAGHGPQVGPDLGRVESRLTREEIENYILDPPKSIPMPSYRNRLTADELKYIMDFVHVAQTFPRRSNKSDGARESK